MLYKFKAHKFDSVIPSDNPQNPNWFSGGYR